MSNNTRAHRLAFIIALLIFACGLATLPFASASCNMQQPKPDAGAREQLRTMTRGGVLPSETAVAQIESDYPNTTAGALARIVRARIKLAANDFNGAASLLDSRNIALHTSIADYALWMRAQALERANRNTEARAAYDIVTRDFPNSLRAREATLRGAQLALQDSSSSASVPALVKSLSDQDDASALFLTAKAYEQKGDSIRALAAYRRIYFYAPASNESAEAASALARLNSIKAPVNNNEAITRANKLYEAKRYGDAADAYAESFARFPATAGTPAQLRRGIAAFQAGPRRASDALTAFNAIPTSAGDARAQALFYLAQVDARARQWDQARATIEELRRSFPDQTLTRRAPVAVGQIAKDAKLALEASNFFRAAVAMYPGAVEMAQAQFELAWAAHESKNYQESSKLLLEHLASYADRNTDNRGRAGYWAARDLERIGRTEEARTIYQGMQQRYDANWYGYLSKQRLEAMPRTNNASQTNFAPGSPVARAVKNLSTVSVAEETAPASANEQLTKADQLDIVGLDDWALAEVEEALKSAPASPRLNLAKARILRWRNGYNDNLQALLTMQKSYPDFSQMKPEELSREEWDALYPLSNWETIKQESRAHSLDPYTVAGLIRQESIFDPRAKSHADAYGLMQLLLDTAQRTARKYNLSVPASVSELYDPRLNIRIGTAYLRDQLDRFGRIEYVAAAYNAGPGRAERWMTELPHDIDEWAEAVPFKETRTYIQGVVRNGMQYRRLYDEQGRFRAEVGTRPVRPVQANANAPQQPHPADNSVRPRRVSPEEEETNEP